MPMCERCGTEHPRMGECPALGLNRMERKASAHASVTRQIVAVLLEVPVVLLTVVAAVVSVFTLPVLCLITVPGLALGPAAVVFLIGYAYHSRFTVLGTLLGWLAAGIVLLCLYMATARTEISPARVACVAALLLVMLPGLGAITDICGARYRAGRHWKYVALPGACLVIAVYAYCVYDWWSYCGRI